MAQVQPPNSDIKPASTLSPAFLQLDLLWPLVASVRGKFEASARGNSEATSSNTDLALYVYEENYTCGNSDEQTGVCFELCFVSDENYTLNPPQDEGFSQPAHSLVLPAAPGKFEASARGSFDEATVCL